MKNNVFLSSRHGLVLSAMALSLLMLAGCAHESASSGVYTYGQAQREQVARLGTVQSVRNITIQRDRTTGAGVGVGGALGGVAGSAIGGGRGKVLTTIGGGALGAYAGDKLEHAASRVKGLEIVVLMDSGETRVIAQEADVAISQGQRVRVISGAGPVRVAPI